MNYKSWNELIETESGKEQFKRMNYTLSEAKDFFSNHTVTDGMKSDYAKILLLKLANLYNINTLENVEAKSPGLLTDNFELMNDGEKMKYPLPFLSCFC